MLKKLNIFLKYADTNCLQRRKEVWTLSNILFVGILTGTSSLENNLAYLIQQKVHIEHDLAILFQHIRPTETHTNIQGDMWKRRTLQVFNSKHWKKSQSNLNDHKIGNG